MHPAAIRVDASPSAKCAWAVSAGWTTPSFTPRTSAWFDANNRLGNAGLGVQGDAAGNQTQLSVSAGTVASYDAENRMSKIAVGAAEIASYTYDAEGRRVAKTAGGATTYYFYDAGGQLTAEYGVPAQTAGTHYFTTDSLGSTRLILDGTGGCLERLDYAPFGGQISRSYDCYGGASNEKPLFTGQMRDGESTAGTDTGQDYFNARYLWANTARFTSADAPFADQRPEDGQSWNLYAYVRNNPLRYTDPTGMNYTVCNAQDLCWEMSDDEYDKWRQAQGRSLIITPGGNILDRETETKIGSARYYDEKPLEALKQAGNRAARDTSTFMISSAAFATAYLGTYAIPAVVATMGATASWQSGVVVIFRAQQLAHAMRSSPGHNTPLGTMEEIKAAVITAVEAGSYSAGAGGVVKGATYIRGVAHEFTGFMRASGEMVFSNIYRK